MLDPVAVTVLLALKTSAMLLAIKPDQRRRLARLKEGVADVA